MSVISATQEAEEDSKKKKKEDSLDNVGRTWLKIQQNMFGNVAPC
jgi:hypothetical protein